MWETPSYSLLILLICLIKVGEIRAQCERPNIGADRILAEDTSQNIFPEGTTLTYKCGTGYVPVPSGRTITCKEKQWTELELQCTKKSCGSLDVLQNGKYLTPNGILFGATAIAQCDEGFMVSGPNTRNCRDNGWDGRQAECEGVKCAPPSGIPHGTFEPMEEFYVYNQAVTYSCDGAYTLIGESTIVCSDNRTFHPSPPQCLLVACETPNIDNANRVEGKRSPYGYKHFVRYQCVQGYTMMGSGYLVCKENGWNPPPPTCISDRIDPKPKPSLIPGPIPTQGPTPTKIPADHNKKIAIGIGVALLLAAVVIGGVVFYLKKRAHWGKVPTRNEECA